MWLGLEVRRDALLFSCDFATTGSATGLGVSEGGATVYEGSFEEFLGGTAETALDCAAGSSAQLDPGTYVFVVNMLCNVVPGSDTGVGTCERSFSLTAGTEPI